jgi:DME family drug/metabolite transporter
LAPIFVGIITWIYYKKRPGKTWAVGTFLGVAGITALNWPGSDASINFAGIGFAALAAFSYSWQAIGMSQLAKRHNAFQTVAPAFTVASFIQVPLTFGMSYEFLTEPILLLGAIYGAIATLALAYSLFAYGVHRIGPANAVTVGLMEPVTAVILGVISLDEVITPFELLGIISILMGLLFINNTRKQ